MQRMLSETPFSIYARVTFRIMKFGRYVTVDDGGNYVAFHELNVRIKILKDYYMATIVRAL